MNSGSGRSAIPTTGEPANGNGWHPEQIKAAVRMRGITLADLSRRHGYAPDACRRALRNPHPRVERIIAEALGVTPSQLWPERYAEAAHG